MDLRGHLDLLVLATLRRTGPVHGYGLIVALDRDGQATKALEMMQGYGYNHKVLFPDPPRPPPFFVPDGDVHWYQSIGMESKGDYQSAINHMTQFLTFQPKSPYVGRAKERIKTLEGKLRRSRGKKPSSVQPDAYLKTWELPPAEIEKLKRDEKKANKKKKHK